MQGIPLRPGTRYAAVITTDLASDEKQHLSAGADMKAIATGIAPTGLSAGALAEYEDALVAIAGAGTPKSKVAALTVFTTEDPTAEMIAALAVLVSKPLPVPAPT